MKAFLDYFRGLHALQVVKGGKTLLIWKHSLQDH